ncbi:MAG TPA: hypothetical protein PKC54_14140 [Ferruginibacter sp.]|nr:hypothetical protein [Ferruginibacter sp.]
MSKKNPFKQPSLWALVFLISFFLLWLSLYAFRLSWLTKPEESVVKISTGFKKFVNEHIFPGSIYDRDFIADNFILINTTEDAGLAASSKDDGGAPVITAITNRGKLAELFKWLVENDSLYKMVVCDLAFTDPSFNSAEDSALGKYINLLMQKDNPKIIFGGLYDEEHRKFEQSVFKDINENPGFTANTKYNMRGYGFIEYTLSAENNTVKSLPLSLYEKVNNCTAADGRIFKMGSYVGTMGLLKLKTPGKNTQRVWNTFAPEIIFDAEAIDSLGTYENASGKQADIPCRVRLGTAVEDEVCLPYLCSRNKEKIIFIGAFGGGHNDTHETLYGQTDGSIILLNIYYSLTSGKNRLKVLFLVVLFVIYFLVAVDIVFTGYLHPVFYKVTNILFLLFIPRLLLDGLGLISPGFKMAAKDYEKWVMAKSHYFILLLTAVIANVFFNRIINIIIIAFAVLILHKLIKYLYGTRGKQFSKMH